MAAHGDRLIDKKELRSKVPYHPQQIARMEAAAQFPRRVHLGPGRVAWSEAEVDNWIEARKAERPAVAA